MRTAALMIPAVLLCVFPGIVQAQATVPPGVDSYQVDALRSVLDFSRHPIPADAFGPGSDPFAGIVPVHGVPLDSHPACPGEDLRDVHVLFERMEELVFPVDPSSDVVPVRLRALGLRNIDPITVTFDGNKRAQQFNVYWCAPAPGDPDPPQAPWAFELGPGPAPWPLIPTLPTFPSEAESLRVDLVPALPTPESPAVPMPLSPEEEPVPWTWARPTTGDKRAACGQDVCGNPDTARLYDLGVLQVYLQGVCSEAPVASTARSWGRFKSHY